MSRSSSIILAAIGRVPSVRSASKRWIGDRKRFGRVPIANQTLDGRKKHFGSFENMSPSSSISLAAIGRVPSVRSASKRWIGDRKRFGRVPIANQTLDAREKHFGS